MVPASIDKPIILLDVDGVINMLDSHSQNAWDDIQVTDKLQAANNKKFRVAYSTSMVNSINMWNKIGEIRWLTTWNQFAITDLSPAIGLDEFKLTRIMEEEKEESGEKLDQSGGKLNCAMTVAKEVGDDRLIIWIDDAIIQWRFEEKMQFLENRPNTILLSPFDGLLPEHIKLVNDCLNDPSSWMGKNIQEYEYYQIRVTNPLQALWTQKFYT